MPKSVTLDWDEYERLTQNHFYVGLERQRDFEALIRENIQQRRILELVLRSQSMLDERWLPAEERKDEYASLMAFIHRELNK